MFPFVKLGEQQVADGTNTAEAVARSEPVGHEEPESRLPESEDPTAQIPTSSGQDEETAMEDVLIISADKEGLVDDAAPAEQEREADHRKDRIREHEKDDPSKLKERVSVYMSMRLIFIMSVCYVMFSCRKRSERRRRLLLTLVGKKTRKRSKSLPSRAEPLKSPLLPPTAS